MGIFEFLYYLGYSVKKYYSLRNQKRLPYKVISIGNITVGGAGKTPATIALAEKAKKRGFSPIILTRGYKGTAKGPCFVSASTSDLPHFCTSALEAGDEPVLMAERLKDVPIVKCADRYKGGIFAIQNLNLQLTTHNSQTLFILDDGFQHWRLFRDKNILLIDAENPFDNRRLLPVGLLREPLKEIRRADVIIITKIDEVKSHPPGRTAVKDLIEEIKKYNSHAPIFLSEHRPTGLVKPSGEVIPLDWVKDKKVFAFCGIANPDSFKKTILSINETHMLHNSTNENETYPPSPSFSKGGMGGLSGENLKGFKAYRDHYKYEQRDIDIILLEARKNNSDCLITTEKDMVRLKGLNLPDNLIALAIEFVVDKKFYEEVFNESSKI